MGGPSGAARVPPGFAREGCVREVRAVRGDDGGREDGALLTRRVEGECGERDARDEAGCHQPRVSSAPAGDAPRRVAFVEQREPGDGGGVEREGRGEEAVEPPVVRLVGPGFAPEVGKVQEDHHLHDEPRGADEPREPDVRVDDGGGEEEGEEHAQRPRGELEGPAPVVHDAVADVRAVGDTRGERGETREEEERAQGDAVHGLRAEPRGGGVEPDARGPGDGTQQGLRVVAQEHREERRQGEERDVQRSRGDLGDGLADRAAPGARRGHARAPGARGEHPAAREHPKRRENDAATRSARGRPRGVRRRAGPRRPTRVEKKRGAKRRVSTSSSSVRKTAFPR